MKRIIIVLFCVSLIVGCKQEKALQTEEKAVVEEVKPSILNVEIEYTSDTDDIIQCMFNKIELDNNQEGNFILTQKVKASEKTKTLNFKMFGDYVSSLVQLRLGKEPKSMMINSLKIEYGESNLEIDGSELKKYFGINKFIDYSSDKKTVVTKKIGNNHFPALTLKPIFVKNLFDL